ncbi:MAG: hypothetical protein V1875_02770 [Candidatus Altiarchaeota archaeon]
MAKIEDIDAPGILGITDQQLNLLKTVYKLSSKNKAASPKEIELTYAKDFGGGIQKSNLFRQMKILQDKDFLTREGEANYKLNLEGLKKTLDQRKTEYQQKITHYEQLSGELEEYFKKTTANPEKPMVEYLEYNEMFDKIAKLLERSKRYYVVSKFTNISYPYTLSDGLKLERYLEVMRRKCFKEKSLEINYLTSLSIEYPYDRFMSIHNDHDMAIKECDAAITNLESLVSLNKNLKVMYTEFPYGMDVLLPEGEVLQDYFMFVRDSKQMAIGGIYIKSSSTAIRAKEEFQKNCENAIDISGPEKDRIFSELRKRLKELDKARGK